MVPLPPAPGALPGQPIQWAPVVAYGQVTYSQQTSFTTLPPPPANPEWTALVDEDSIPIGGPALSLPLSPPAAVPLQQATGGDSDQGRQNTLLPPPPPPPPPPPATAPDSAAGDQGQVPADLGQGMDWFVVPTPASPGIEGNAPSDEPSAHIQPEDGGAPSSNVRGLFPCRTSLIC